MSNESGIGNIVEVHQLSKTFVNNSKKGDSKPIVAIDDISFAVSYGEVFAFLGPNGSGKTTTINILSRLLSADSGDVRIFGRNQNDPSYYQDVSFMIGDSDFFWSSTGSDILRFYSRLKKRPWKEVLELIDQFQFQDKLNRRWAEYSNGEKTRLRLINALVGKPKLLFLDEPTVGLDPDMADSFRTELRKLNKEGMTIVLTSHYMKDVTELAKRVCFIHRGKIREIRPIESFRSPNELVDLEFTEAFDPMKLSLLKHNTEISILNEKTIRIQAPDIFLFGELGTVKSIHPVEADLEEYFINLAREL
jgi:ABC-2 type transport system ATP-binding protein